MFRGKADFCMIVLKAECEVNQQKGEEFKCYMIWKMMVAILHSDEQLRTVNDGGSNKLSKTCCTAEDYC